MTGAPALSGGARLVPEAGSAVRLRNAAPPGESFAKGPGSTTYACMTSVTFASRALAMGEGLPMIGDLLGHRMVNTTARYAHLQRDSVRKSSARVSNRTVAALSVERDTVFWDRELTGFGVRVYPSV